MSSQSSEKPVQDAKEGEMACWQKIARKVESIDEAKIERVNKDMDIVLIFAGLFSAVLTTLLVAALSNLQEDNSATSAQLLRQLVLLQQNRSDASNTPQDVLDPTPFSPPTSAIVVGVLWFASLLVTLSIASLALLVQQWLREYLSTTDNNPLARLRIRQFRYKGLIRWKVFDIASMLPLLLQLSLALFYIGLCVYTLSIHVSIGWTCIPLVGSWIILFLLVTASPLVSARCPYRTSLFPDTLKKLRKVFRVLRRPKFTAAWIRELREASKKALEWPFSGWLKEDEGMLGSAEEEEISRSSHADLEILYSGDVARLHDEESYVSQLASFLHHRTPAESAFKFVLQGIHYQLPPLPAIFKIEEQSTDEDVWSTRVPSLPLIDHRRLRNLQPLSPGVFSGLVHAAIAFIEGNHDRERGFKTLGAYMERAILVLFAKSSHWSIINANQLKKVQRELLDPEHLFRTDVLRILSKADFPRVWEIIQALTAQFELPNQSYVVKTILRYRTTSSPPLETEWDTYKTVVECLANEERTSGLQVTSEELGRISYILKAELCHHINALTEHSKQSQVTCFHHLVVISLMTHARYGPIATVAFNALFTFLCRPNSSDICYILPFSVTGIILKALSRYLYSEETFMKANDIDRDFFLRCLHVLMETHFNPTNIPPNTTAKSDASQPNFAHIDPARLQSFA